MRIHFIGIGGSIMHALAIHLKKQGHEVTGSDDEIYSPAKENLERENLLPHTLGWNPERIHSNLDLVIVGMHAQKNNPELTQALKLQIPIKSYPELISELSQHKQRVVIAGSYGKTTTTALVIHVLQTLGYDFDFLIGGKIKGMDSNLRLSNSAPLIILEGDEYPASPLHPEPKFLYYQPHIAAITGIAWDHLNVFPSEEEYYHAFEKLIQNLPKAGTLIYPEKEKRIEKWCKTYLNKEAHYVKRVKPLPIIRTRRGIIKTRVGIYEGNVPLIGNHNFLNLALAWAICEEFAVSPAEFLGAIETFPGVEARMETLFQNEEFHLIRDFAHTPEKLNATIQAIKKFLKPKRLFILYELHSFSNFTKTFLSKFEKILPNKDTYLYISPKVAKKRGAGSALNEWIKRFQAKGISILQSPEQILDLFTSKIPPHSTILIATSGNFDGIDFKKAIKEKLAKK